MMLSWFGNPWTWLLLFVMWLVGGAVVALMFGVMANIEKWVERRKRQ